jgi:hypothetical protein
MYGGGSGVTLNQAETSVDTLKQDRKETSAILGKTFQYLVGKLQAFQKEHKQLLEKTQYLLDNSQIKANDSFEKQSYMTQPK